MASQNIDIIIQAKDLASKALKNIKGRLDTVQGSLEANKATFQKMAVAGTVALTGIGALIRKTTQDAAEAEGTWNKFNTVFGEGADNMTKFVNDIRTRMPVATDDIARMAADLQDLLVPLGLSRELGAEMTQGFLETANAVGAFNDVNPKEVLDAISSGLTGISMPLKRFGVDASVGALEAVALEKGLLKAGQSFAKLEPEIRNQIRAQALLIQVNEQSSDAINGFAENSDSLIFRQLELKATISDLSGIIGNAFIPIIDSVVKSVVPVVKNLASWAEKNPELIATIAKLSVATAGLVTLLGTLGLVVPLVGRGMVIFGSSMLYARKMGLLLMNTSKKLLLLFVGMSAPMLLLAGVVAGVVFAIYKNWDSLKIKLKPVFEFIAKAGALAPEIISRAWNAGVSVIAFSAKTIVNSAKFIVKQLNKIPGISIDTSGYDAALAKIDSFSEGAKISAEDVAGAFSKIKNTASDAISTVKDFTESVSIDSSPDILGAGGGFEESAGKAKSAIKEVKEEAYKFDEALKTVSKTAIKLASALYEKSGLGIGLVKMQETLDNVKDKFKDAFGNNNALITESENRVKSLRGEVENLNSQLKNLKDKGSDVESGGREELAKRALEIEKELQDAELDLIKKKELEQELALATEKAGITAMQEAREWQAMSESERIIASTQEKQAAIEEEIQGVRNLLFQKYKAIEEEEVRMQELKDKKILFENEFQKLFMENATARQTSIDRAIKSMLKLNALSGSVVNYDAGAISGARAQGGAVNAGQAYMVGEKGRELFVPKTSGTIVSNDGLGGSGGVTINMGGVTVQNAADENRLIEKMKTMLKQESKAFNLGIA